MTKPYPGREVVASGQSSRFVVESGALGEAHFSEDRRYRYLLTRGAQGPRGAHSRVVFVMLNPSTADHDQNDQTIRKCIGFAERVRHQLWDDLAIEIVNLFAIRATDPDNCFAALAPIGGEVNDAAILAACRDADLVVCAWGAYPKAQPRASQVRQMLRVAGVELHRFAPPRLVKTGRYNYPAHPLYLAGDTPIESWA